MSSPRVLIQIAIVGAQIFGKALAAAGRQAVQNAKHRPGMAEEVAGVRNADAITQTHKMTLDEAHLILNAKKGDSLTTVLKNYENLFKINSPSEAPKPTPPSNATPTTAAGRRAATAAAPIRYHSHYIQSKVVRARERIEAEMKIQQEAEDAQRTGTNEAEAPPASSETKAPPPPPPS